MHYPKEKTSKVLISFFFSFLFSALNETQKQYTNSNHHNNHLLNPSSDNNNSKKAAKLTSSSKKLSSQHPINIHIEVDIDPPANEQPQLSPEELQSLGLPTNHVHFDVNNNNIKQLTSADSSEGEHHEELLAPSDIRVTYTEEDEEEKVRLTSFKHFIFCNK